MDITKKPYEISLWDEKLYWHRRKLNLVGKLEESDYEPGKYYSQNADPESVLGQIPYTLDYTDWIEDRDYYELAPYNENNYKEGPSAADVILEEGEWEEESTIIQYYKEQKICNIGSNASDSPIRATSPKLTANVNGSNTLVFTMYYQYWDEEQNELVWNPYIKYLTNERKVKLKYGKDSSGKDKWYDFIIKNISEDSSSKAFTYTCKDLFINELSKSGFDLVLDVELANNMGTLTELAEVVLDESDWSVKNDNNFLVKQYNEEALYKVKIANGFSAIVMYADSTDGSAKEINEDDVIYLFYDSFNKKGNTIQFLYDENGVYKKDDANVIVGYTDESKDGAHNYTVSGIIWKDGEDEDDEEEIYLQINDTTFLLGRPQFESSLRGKRIIKSPITKYDPSLKKTVSVYTDENNSDSEVFGYIETKYYSPTAVVNTITNPSSFTSRSGWSTWNNSQEELSSIELYGYPKIEDISSFTEDYTFSSYLKFTPKEKLSALLNSGLNDNRTQIGSFTKEEEYWIRSKIYNSAEATQKSENYDIIISEYELDNNIYKLIARKATGEKTYIDLTGRYEQGKALREKIFPLDGGYYPLFTREKWISGTQISIPEELKIDGWVDKYTCRYSISEEEYKTKKIGIFIIGTSVSPLYIKELEFFKSQYGVDTEGQKKLCYPGATLNAFVENNYCYYKEFNSPTPPNIEMAGITPNPSYVPKYAENGKAYEKTRSITAKESNRFNLIQELCELFECWARFEIEHDKDGAIALDENYRQKKYVSFHEYIGIENPVSFRYGINLKSIKRTLDSSGVSTKLVVKDNSNEFADGGFCSISRANENPGRDNVLYDFGYYVGQNLINFNDLNQDLYGYASHSNGYLGYYTQLKEINVQYQSLSEEKLNINISIMNEESTYQTYYNSYVAATSEYNEKCLQFQELTGTPIELFFPEKRPATEGAYDSDIFAPCGNEYVRNIWWGNSKAVSLATSIVMLKEQIRSHKTIAENAEAAKNSYEERKAIIDESLEQLRKRKIALNKRFYQKYSRYIQEGSWVSEDYVDDNLYYFDALSTLYTSSRPKTSYTIDVIELSTLPEYKDYVFEVGDKTYVEDREFFGWAYDGSNRAYREEVVISEITTELDEPDKNKIKVQNYKTQFEDLFSRVAAATAQIEFSTGEYQKGSSIVNNDRTIATSVLQNSMENNSIILSNSNSQSVIMGDHGIEARDLYKPNEVLRIVSGGIFLSTDNGGNWTTGISASGINASCLTTGVINASVINITNGGNSSFRWDEAGITAYRNTNNGVINNTFTRFDQFGFYGIQGGDADFNALKMANGDLAGALALVQEKAQFGFTWNKFWLKSTGTSTGTSTGAEEKSYVSISSDNDFQVYRGDNPIITIGRLTNNNDNYYGIRIRNSNKDTVLETGSDGQLWLKDKLTIETSDNSNVEIGKLGDGQVINANGTFIVKQDGTVSAQNISITGSSTVGGLTMAQIQNLGQSSYDVYITSTEGTIFKNNNGETILKAHVYQAGEEITQVGYQWYLGNEIIVGATGQTLTVSNQNWKDYGQNGTLNYTCKITIGEEGGTD